MANSVTCLECTSDKLMHLSRVLLIRLSTCTNLMKCSCFKAQTNAFNNWPLPSKDPTLIWIRTLMKKRGRWKSRQFRDCCSILSHHPQPPWKNRSENTCPFQQHLEGRVAGEPHLEAEEATAPVVTDNLNILQRGRQIKPLQKKIAECVQEQQCYYQCRADLANCVLRHHAQKQRQLELTGKLQISGSVRVNCELAQFRLECWIHSGGIVQVNNWGLFSAQSPNWPCVVIIPEI